jgi:hypothetical protein
MVDGNKMLQSGNIAGILSPRDESSENWGKADLVLFPSPKVCVRGRATALLSMGTSLFGVKIQWVD